MGIGATCNPQTDNDADRESDRHRDSHKLIQLLLPPFRAKETKQETVSFLATDEMKNIAAKRLLMPRGKPCRLLLKARGVVQVLYIGKLGTTERGQQGCFTV